MSLSAYQFIKRYLPHTSLVYTLQICEPHFHKIRITTAIIFIYCFSTPVYSQPETIETELVFSNKAPVISIIIDDMGYQKINGINAIKLPGPIAYSFLPDAPFTKTLIDLADSNNKKIMLHLPLESTDNLNMEHDSITLSMSKPQTLAVLNKHISNIPNIIGINNHMGSLYTESEPNMHWLMQGIKQHKNLFFVDSYTVHTSIALTVARQHQVPSVKRDVFLDNSRLADDIAYQFRRLIRKAHKQGAALAIAHPHPETIKFLQNKLPELNQLGVNLVSIPDYIEIQNNRSATWQAYLSRSHKAAKNLKP